MIILLDIWLGEDKKKDQESLSFFSRKWGGEVQTTAHVIIKAYYLYIITYFIINKDSLLSPFTSYIFGGILNLK